MHTIIYKIDNQQENYTHYPVITYKGKESKKEYIYETESLFCAHHCKSAIFWFGSRHLHLYSCPANRLICTIFSGFPVKVKVTQSCLTHCDPMDYTVLGIR